ncbi:hypothetical protein ACJ41O_006008 [Fusarium nematophilum]
MSQDHPYLHLSLPQSAPFELRTSPGKGWGAFATTEISKGTVIFREKALFVIQKHHTQITERDLWLAFQQLSPAQKQQFSLLRYNSSQEFCSFREAMAENSFQLATPHDSSQGNTHAAHGLYLLQSRFNHSCLPNSKVPMPLTDTVDDVIKSVAARDIEAGEEITICYDRDFETKTRQERHEALRFVCDCKACHLGTGFQQLSDIRRQFIRGLRYLLDGFDLDRQRHQPGCSIITDGHLKHAAENYTIPVSSRLVYLLLIIVLVEEEGLLDEYMELKLGSEARTLASLLKTKANARVARSVMAQESWMAKLNAAIGLYERPDGVDSQLTEEFRLTWALP